MSNEPLLNVQLTESLTTEQLHAIKTALTAAGFRIDENLAEGRITVEPDGEVQLSDEYADLDSKEIRDKVRRKHTIQQGTGSTADVEDHAEPMDKPDDDTVDEASETDDDVDEPTDSSDEDSDDIDEAADDDSGASVMAQRAARLENQMDHSTAYTSRELAAIAFDIDEDEVTASERGTLSQIKNRTSFKIKSVDHPDSGNKKLYYRGKKPDLLQEASEDAADEDTAKKTYSCSECGRTFDAPVTANPNYHDCNGVDEDGSDETGKPDTSLSSSDGEGDAASSDLDDESGMGKPTGNRETLTA